nr:venom peptide SjAPI-like isoform X1 [Plodia interpunctella]
MFVLTKFKIITFISLFVLVSGYRTSICTRDNEEFSLCGWKCPSTCVNMRLINLQNVRCPTTWGCRVGCRCSAGYLREEYTKQCVLSSECPGHTECPEGEVMGWNLQCISRRRIQLTNYSVWQEYG